MKTLILLFSISLGSSANEKWQDAKEQFLEVEQAERQILGTLYAINQRMKDMSKKRDRLTDRLFLTDSDVRQLARGIAQLEGRLKDQRQGLRHRLRMLYLLHGESALRSLFSAQSAIEFDRNLRFLKRITDRDYGLIKDYEVSLKTLLNKRRRIDAQVRYLMRLKNALKDQEQRLALEQENKGSLLAKLQVSREHHLQDLKRLRRDEVANKGKIDTAFFEQKGQLPTPVSGRLTKDFGYIEDEVYRYRLGHKGFFYKTEANAEVRAVFRGQVAFADEVPGYGLTMIIDHGDHYYTLYSHLLAVQAKPGDRIESDQAIGMSGGPSPWFGHGLYFEIRHFSDAIDPKPWLKAGTTMKTSQI